VFQEGKVSRGPSKENKGLYFGENMSQHMGIEAAYKLVLVKFITGFLSNFFFFFFFSLEKDCNPLGYRVK
jgi:hypothetical protein